MLPTLNRTGLALSLLVGAYASGAPNFTPLTSAFPVMQIGNLAWGDYDQDGDLDLLATGYDASFVPHVLLYRNHGSNFVEVTSGLPTDGHYYSNAWGDYDQDGDLDLMLVNRLFRNNAGQFVPGPLLHFLH